MSDSDDTCPMRFAPESREVSESEDELDQLGETPAAEILEKTSRINDEVTCSTRKNHNLIGPRGKQTSLDSFRDGRGGSAEICPSPVMSLADSAEELRINDKTEDEIVPEDPEPVNCRSMDHTTDDIELLIDHEVNHQNIVTNITPSDPMIIDGSNLEHAVNSQSINEIYDDSQPTNLSSDDRPNDSCPAWVPVADYESPPRTPNPDSFELAEEEARVQEELARQKSKNNALTQDDSEDGSKTDDPEENKPFRFFKFYPTTELPDYSPRRWQRQLESTLKDSNAFNETEIPISMASTSSTIARSDSPDHSVAKKRRRSEMTVFL